MPPRPLLPHHQDFPFRCGTYHFRPPPNSLHRRIREEQYHLPPPSIVAPPSYSPPRTGLFSVSAPVPSPAPPSRRPRATREPCPRAITPPFRPPKL
ncbi:hypothetical protein LshimejAT787_0905950 [Lyophyllum shimeji]|uniref:Uncharacterized protein n=1 Tax=Lyophyllum shimeji TaxID=47721 RepID=A0A9P3URI7_LYOSH|nr:hypothetical protein LshimejAT787_0905950 [Lyophyllum shimeji]